MKELKKGDTIQCADWDDCVDTWQELKRSGIYSVIDFAINQIKVTYVTGRTGSYYGKH